MEHTHDLFHAQEAEITISTAATLAGTTIVTTATATKAIAMTTLQKTLIAATLVAAVGTGIYEARQASILRTQVQTLQRATANARPTERLNQLREDAATTQATLQQENDRLRQALAEVPRLRGELARLRSTQQQAQSKAAGVDANDRAVQSFLAAKAKAEQITRFLEQMPDKAIPELKLLTDVDWLAITKEAKFDTDDDVRKTLSKLRSLAKQRMFMGSALYSFTHANNGQLPTDMFQLKPGFKSALQDHGATTDDETLDAIFERYTLLHAGNLSDFPQDTWFIVEKAPVDKDYDSRAKFGNGRSTVVSTGIEATGDPDDKSY